MGGTSSGSDFVQLRFLQFLVTVGPGLDPSVCCPVTDTEQGPLGAGDRGAEEQMPEALLVAWVGVVVVAEPVTRHAGKACEGQFGPSRDPRCLWGPLAQAQSAGAGPCDHRFGEHREGCCHSSLVQQVFLMRPVRRPFACAGSPERPQDDGARTQQTLRVVVTQRRVSRVSCLSDILRPRHPLWFWELPHCPLGTAGDIGVCASYRVL